ncbi:MAG: alpha-L-arabinofuranosidase C-terminal domain-containing protein [Paludibacter sp.]|nr:alpha-L-arabinofuranosidase C-terminal domain-containing protein [Paludibacter sp.]
MSRRQQILFYLLIVLSGLNAQSKLTIDLSKKGVNVSPTHYGIFFEDINHSADGGLYAELIKNRSFEDAITVTDWTPVVGNGASMSLFIDNTNLLNSSQANELKMVASVATANARAGVSNSGYWGINLIQGKQYTLSFFARRNTTFSGIITASLESSAGVVFAKNTISGITTDWQKYTCTFIPTVSSSTARLVLSANSAGIIWFDVVSLFPPTFKDRPNGLRPELVQKMVDLHPKFMRFPGGCFVEGDYLTNRFQWKQTIGPIETRPGHNNLWGYRTTDGMGYHEFLQLSEDLGAEPLYVFNVGVSHNDFVLYNQVDAYIQDAFDAIEYANGPVTSTYGAMRAANGHPEPFNLKYVEIGNENSWNDHYADRFYLFLNAMKAKYPTMICIADGEGTSVDHPSFKVSETTDFMDEHYYSDPQWFINQAFRYDSYSRTGPKIYVGEYAVTSGCGLGNLSAAVGEAAYMTGMEKNSDIVPMNSYAPLFVNVNDRKWNPNLINYDASSVYVTPSYYVQSMFANNIGDIMMPVKDSLVSRSVPINGAIGLGTWSTVADYSNVQVVNNKGSILYADQFANSSKWTPGTGTWTVASNIYTQSSTLTDCRSISSTITDSVYTYTLKARKTSGSEGFLILFGYKDSNNYYWWNIGGWGNTLNAIEQCVGGTKSTLTSAAGSVATNQWYDIKIDFTKDKVYFYINNILVHTLNSSAQFLFTSASLETANHNLFLKVVNSSSSPVTSEIDLHNMNTNLINGTITELTSGNVADENSIVNPTNVIPVIKSVYSDTTVLNYTFKANSVNVLKLNVDNAYALNLQVEPKKEPAVYPSFTHSEIFVTTPVDGKYSICVLNTSGKQLINNEAFGIHKIDLSGFNAGVYLVRVNSGSGIFVKKVIKY